MAENERFILYQSVKTICSLAHQDEQTRRRNHINGPPNKHARAHSFLREVLHFPGRQKPTGVLKGKRVMFGYIFEKWCFNDFAAVLCALFALR